MKKKETKLFSKKLPLLASFLLAAVSCGPAGYEILRPGKDGEKSGEPTPITENSGDANKNNAPTNLPPTAGIEVIETADGNATGKSVTKVRINTKTIVRPTADTMDADDYGRSSCANPGIVQADYELPENAKAQAKRSQGCEDLGVPHTFTKAGTYLIKLVVLTNENEQATASMTLIVYEGNEPDDGGFKIKAHPMIGTTADDITFDGICNTKKGVKQITWKFGDSTTGAGSRTTHRYQKEGQYQVQATCETNDGKRWEAHITIVIVPESAGRPPKGPVPPPVSPDQPTPNPGKPGQNGPGQNGPGQKPGQQPGQLTPIKNPPVTTTVPCQCACDCTWM